jgi:hypothetical protein
MKTGWSEQEAEWWNTGTLDASLAIAAAIRSQDIRDPV